MIVIYKQRDELKKLNKKIMDRSFQSIIERDYEFLDLPGVETDRIVLSSEIRLIGRKEMDEFQFGLLNELVNLIRKRWGLSLIFRKSN